MGVDMSVNAVSERFSPKSNAALIDIDDFLNGVIDNRWAIIMFGNCSSIIISLQLSCGHLFVL